LPNVTSAGLMATGDALVYLSALLSLIEN